MLDKLKPNMGTEQVPEFPHGVWVGLVFRPEEEGAGCAWLAGDAVQAGFPSPAEDYMEHPLDLNAYLAPYPEATFFVRVSGDSMTGAGIHHDDILVVDKSRRPAPGNVVIAVLDGEFTVKRLVRTATGMALMAENPDYPPIPLTEDADFQVWGVVRHVIHAV